MIDFQGSGDIKSDRTPYTCSIITFQSSGRIALQVSFLKYAIHNRIVIVGIPTPNSYAGLITFRFEIQTEAWPRLAIAAIIKRQNHWSTMFFFLFLTLVIIIA